MLIEHWNFVRGGDGKLIELMNVKSEFASTRDRDLTSGNFSSQVELKHDKYFIS